MSGQGYQPTEAQLGLRRLIRDKSRILAFGGSRSGKTFEFCRAVAVFMLRYNGLRAAIFRRYANAVRSSAFADTFPKMMDLCFPGYVYEVNKTLGEIYFPHNGSEVCFVGLDDDRRIEKILGREFGILYFNESSEINYNSIEIASTRLAQRCFDDSGKLLRNRIFFDCNPPGKSHWIYRLFVEQIHPVSRLRLANCDDYGAIQINPTDNAANLPPDYISQTLATGSERAKRRFLYGEFAEENENALWKSATMIDPYRLNDVPDELERIVVGVDPAVTSAEASDHTGIIVAGSKHIDGDEHYFVLQDLSLIAPPERWAGQVVEAYDDWLAELVVAEVNQGGDLVESVLRNVAPNLPIRKVRASRGKIVRAEPISALYAQGRVHHVGQFADLEGEMTSYTGAGSSEDSPDRLDALVWALTELSASSTGSTSQGALYFG
jgi:PBSX family phage terminase large subunit